MSARSADHRVGAAAMQRIVGPGRVDPDHQCESTRPRGRHTVFGGGDHSAPARPHGQPVRRLDQVCGVALGEAHARVSQPRNERARVVDIEQHRVEAAGVDGDRQFACLPGPPLAVPVVRASR